MLTSIASQQLMSLLRRFFICVIQFFCVRYAFWCVCYPPVFATNIFIHPKKIKNSDTLNLVLDLLFCASFYSVENRYKIVYTQFIGSQEKNRKCPYFIHFGFVSLAAPFKERQNSIYNATNVTTKWHVLCYVFIAVQSSNSKQLNETRSKFGVLFITTVRFQLLWCCFSNPYIKQPPNSVPHKLSHMWRWTGKCGEKALRIGKSTVQILSRARVRMCSIHTERKRDCKWIGSGANVDKQTV